MLSHFRILFLPSVHVSEHLSLISGPRSKLCRCEGNTRGGFQPLELPARLMVATAQAAVRIADSARSLAEARAPHASTSLEGHLSLACCVIHAPVLGAAAARCCCVMQAAALTAMNHSQHSASPTPSTPPSPLAAPLDTRDNARDNRPASEGACHSFTLS